MRDQDLQTPRFVGGETEAMPLAATLKELAAAGYDLEREEDLLFVPELPRTGSPEATSQSPEPGRPHDRGVPLRLGINAGWFPGTVFSNSPADWLKQLLPPEDRGTAPRDMRSLEREEADRRSRDELFLASTRSALLRARLRAQRHAALWHLRDSDQTFTQALIRAFGFSDVARALPERTMTTLLRLIPVLWEVTCSTTATANAVAAFLEAPVEALPNQPRRTPFHPPDLSRLGKSRTRLGCSDDALVLGRGVDEIGMTCLFRVGPVSLAHAESLIAENWFIARRERRRTEYAPGGALTALAELLMPFELVCEWQLLINSEATRRGAWVLGDEENAQLGDSTILGDL